MLTDLADLRGPRYEVTFMIRFAAFAGLLAIMSPNVAADELWSLYVYEQAVAECGGFPNPVLRRRLVHLS